MRDGGAAAAAVAIDGDHLDRGLALAAATTRSWKCRAASGLSASVREPTRTITRRVPGAAVPATTPYESWYGAGCSIAGGGGGAVSTAAPYRSPRADTRPSRPRRLLRRRRGARGPDAPHPAARRRRQPAGPRRRRDGELRRAAVRNPLGDELGRGAPALPRGRLRAAAAHALPAVLGGGLERDPRGRSPGRAGRDRRGLPRPRHGRRRRSRALGRLPRRCRHRCARRPRSRARSGVSTSKVVCKVASDRRKPGGITVVPPGKEARFLAPFPVRTLPGVGPKAEQRLAAAGVKTVGDLAALARCRATRRPAGDDRPAATRPGVRHRSARPRARRPSGSRSRSRRRSSATSPTGVSSTRRSSAWPPTSPPGSSSGTSRRAP